MDTGKKRGKRKWRRALGLAAPGGIVLLFLLLPPARIRSLLLFGHAGVFFSWQWFPKLHPFCAPSLSSGVSSPFLAVGGVPVALLVLWWVITISFQAISSLRVRTRETRLNRFLLIRPHLCRLAAGVFIIRS